MARYSAALSTSSCQFSRKRSMYGSVYHGQLVIAAALNLILRLVGPMICDPGSTERPIIASRSTEATEATPACAWRTTPGTICTACEAYLRLAAPDPDAVASP